MVTMKIYDDFLLEEFVDMIFLQQLIPEHLPSLELT